MNTNVHIVELFSRNCALIWRWICQFHVNLVVGMTAVDNCQSLQQNQAGKCQERIPPQLVPMHTYAGADVPTRINIVNSYKIRPLLFMGGFL